MANFLTEKYLSACTVAGSRLTTASSELPLPAAFERNFGGALLDRPLFVPRSEVYAFAADLASVFSLLCSLPDRLFDGDLARYCAALGVDERLAGLILRDATGAPPLYGRADAYHDGERFQLLEFNLGSELGGAEIAQLNRAWLGVPAFRRFAEAHGLDHVDTDARIADTLRAAAAPVTGGGEPVVGLIESRGGLSGHSQVFPSIQESLRSQGLDVELGEIQELRSERGKLTLRGRPLDLVLRYFVAGELMGEPDDTATLDLVLDAHRSGRTVLFTPLESGLFASKANLALLHDPRTRATFTPAEAAVVDRTVPWTRSLPAGDLPDDLLDQCRAERESLILKPGLGYGADGAVVGWESDDAEWSRALTRADGQDLVVQRRVRPADEAVIEARTGTVGNWAANWGVFVDAEGYAGSFVRALQPVDGSVISFFANDRTKATCVFHH